MKKNNLRVGYIGIGIMGSGIVLNLRKAGIPVSFTARDNPKAEANANRLVDAGAVRVGNFAELVDSSDVIMMTLPDSSVVESVLGHDGIGSFLRGGMIVIDSSTSYPTSTRMLSEALKEKGVTLLDAPLTGSRIHAETGTLNVMCGGPKDAFEKVEYLFDAIASHIFHVGPVGSGHTIKIINNYFGFVTLTALNETVPFMKKYGVDLKALVDVVSVSGGNSASFQAAMPRIMKPDNETYFQQKLAHKDLGYMNKLLDETETTAPVARLLLSVHEQILKSGFGERDFSRIVEFFGALPYDPADD